MSEERSAATQAPATAPTSQPGDNADQAARGKLEEAQDIVRRHVLWAMGVGIVPIPIVDLLGVTTFQVKMLKELGTLYGVAFDEPSAKSILGSLLTSIGSLAIGGMVVQSLVKSIPFVGTALGMAAIPVTVGAVTQAVGNVFVKHFERGGTFQDFDAAAMSAYFREELEKAKKTVSGTVEKASQKLGNSPQSGKTAQKP